MKFKSFRYTKILALSAMLTFGGVTTASADEAKAPKITTPDAAQWIVMVPEMGNKGPTFSIVFGKPGEIGQPFGGMFRVPAGGESPSHTHTSEYWATMVSGVESAREKGEDPLVKIPAGSTWYQPAGAPHINKCMGPEDCVFFVYYPKGMDYHPTPITK